MSDLFPRQRSEYVSRMFGAIADRYDLMNRVMTFGMDQRWRRQAAELAGVHPGETALDVATGTGDLAFELARQVGPTGHIVAIDFTKEMLHHARSKAMERGLSVQFELADALDLPFPDSAFHAATCGFGLRNFDERLRALEEMTRVIQPGGRVVILELTPPRSDLVRRYLNEVVPRLGHMLARAREAYTYLPQSAQEFPDPDSLGRLMQQAGLRTVSYRLLNFGTIAIHWGVRPPI